MNLYIVIDMQKDFIDGALANPDAAAIVTPMANYLKAVGSNDMIFFTRDTHDDNYLQTYEGQHLPIPHCLFQSAGWHIDQQLQDAVKNRANVKILDKGYFNAGTELWRKALEGIAPDNIILMGTCTDICVISNAFALKEIYPEKDITIIGNLCAGLSPQKHNAALDVLKSCQFQVVNI